MAAQKPLLLDGAMGQEIVNRGGKSGYGDWSIAALVESPEIVQSIHRDYIAAGADVITTNTYSTTRTRLRFKHIEDRLEELAQRAGSLAVTARDEMQRPAVKVAGSFGPLEASYVSEFALSFDEMVAEFRELMTLLDPYVDIYLGETFSTIIEARAFLTAAQGRGKLTWVSWTLHDHGKNTLRGDESITDAIATLDGFKPDAVLLNCTTPDSIDNTVAQLASAGIAFGGYANGFVEVPSVWVADSDAAEVVQSRQDLTPAVYGNHVQSWLDEGATIVGGCCDIGPDHIAYLRQMIDAR